MLAGKRIILGVTGGIAAYKAVEITRRLVDAGAHVVPVMTDAATKFVGETTLSALASETVKTRLWDDPETPIPHTKIGQGADAILIAPATAKLIAQYRMGLSADLLTNILIATRAPVVVCPAMHTEMWEHPAVVDNVATLRDRGVHIVDPVAGRLAGGDVGAGRLAEPADIVARLADVFAPQDLSGRVVVVSAGGTREPIDAVRVIANRSSGKQGHAIAQQAARRGATVYLVTASSLDIPPGVIATHVETAAQMSDALDTLCDRADVVVMAAAVADFTPAEPADRKLKKADGPPVIELVPTVDILTGLGERKPAGQLLVGFAAETNDIETHATDKLARKRLDMIVANDVGADKVGFGHDTNAVTIFTPDAAPRHVDLADKATIARTILDEIVRRLP